MDPGEGFVNLCATPFCYFVRRVGRQAYNFSSKPHLRSAREYELDRAHMAEASEIQVSGNIHLNGRGWSFFTRRLCSHWH